MDLVTRWLPIQTQQHNTNCDVRSKALILRLIPRLQGVRGAVCAVVGVSTGDPSQTHITLLVPPRTVGTQSLGDCPRLSLSCWGLCKKLLARIPPKHSAGEYTCY